MILVPIAYATPAYDQLVKIRQDVLYNPLNANLTIEDLELEYKDGHYALYDEHYRMLGGLVIIRKEEECDDEVETKRRIVVIRQVVVCKNFQRTGAGKAMIQQIESLLKKEGYKEIRLYSYEKAIPFYTNLGYQKMERTFNEKGVKHYRMKKKLTGTQKTEQADGQKKAEN
ncbi:MAG: GNAT family N-acetyltransferase [Aureispira sp.]|nr:GNAT family N-acetyltransferase [Aureispira sp.]